MHMSSRTILALAIGCLVARPAVSQIRTVYIPGIHVLRGVVPPPYADPQYSGLLLVSKLALYNVGTGDATFRRVSMYGTGGALPVVDTTGVVEPGESTSTDTTDSQHDLEMGKYELRGDIVATGSLEIVHEFSNAHCSPGYPFPNPLPSLEPVQGRIPLPIFEELIPGGATAFSGDVVPFNPGPPPPMCRQEYPRRLNVTLFNAGLAPATFIVKAHRSASLAPDFVFTSTYEVPAQSVQQFNSVYTPVHMGDELSRSPNLWFTITADQPFLSYISTTFEDPQPGAIQYEIFPSKLR